MKRKLIPLTDGKVIDVLKAASAVHDLQTAHDALYWDWSSALQGWKKWLIMRWIDKALVKAKFGETIARASEKLSNTYI
ncbi:hypothetical protein LCGC14_2830550 [marine sediment metagenome]|uniref:Uncharacterized protein n=1 Tax=marine sediment metagenome TaxID=412755 RepID=A0A0F8YE68_9ZZZZ